MAFIKLALALTLLAAVALAMPGGHHHAESYASFNLLDTGYHHGGHESHHEDYHYSHPKYEFKYGVEDHHTGDHKDQKEERDGDVVKGEYSLLQPDGRKRIVHYTASKHGGFNAIVSYSGHAIHPEVHGHHEIHGHGF
ncbi:Adult-specific cuticular protein ACP-20 [Frankliniella fusca]|uniref:Adult-specific cuticular protein ACP-20 n=1 Tax=Frankliniella fusca TaxID=407009 RepID=A0AAE1L6D5_9NEOP|nr:Adult-specific cuticular protein ACP-20 [Frankliniella fusca]